MNNLDLYNKVRTVPKEAQKEIQAGRLKGKTDINPMWRIKTLTEQFGVCGFGWKTEIVREWLETGANGEITANVEIRLYIKQDGAWSDAIPGIGGSALVAKETAGLRTDDDCYKKAYTDAISVACKALGIGADVYYAKDSTKYDVLSVTQPQGAKPARAQQTRTATVTEKSVRMLQIEKLIKDTPLTMSKVDEWIAKHWGKAVPVDELAEANYNELYAAIEAAAAKMRSADNGSD